VSPWRRSRWEPQERGLHHLAPETTAQTYQGIPVRADPVGAPRGAASTHLAPETTAQTYKGAPVRADSGRDPTGGQPGQAWILGLLGCYTNDDRHCVEDRRPHSLRRYQTSLAATSHSPAGRAPHTQGASAQPTRRRQTQRTGLAGWRIGKVVASTIRAGDPSGTPGPHARLKARAGVPDG
jgi:hypothetical protein